VTQPEPIAARTLEAGIAEIRLRDEIDAARVTDIQQSVKKLFRANIHRIVFDMSELKFISSTGIGTVLSTILKCRSNQGDVVLVAVPDWVVEVLSLLAIPNVVKIADTTDQAVAHLRQK
jgi:anti-anti-sigma factor